MKIFRYQIVACVFLLGGALCPLPLSPNARAQQSTPAPEATPPPVVSTGLSVELLTLRLSEYQSASNLNDAQKARAVESCREALNALKAALALAEKTAAQAKELQVAPDQIKTIRDKLAIPPEPIKESDPQLQGSVEEIEKRLGALRLELSAVEGRLNELRGQLSQQNNRPPILRTLITEARSKIDELNRERQAPPSAETEPAAVIESRGFLYQARLKMRQEELQAYEQELAGYDMRVALLTAMQDEALRESARLKTLVDTLQQRLVAERQKEAEKQREESSASGEILASAPPVIRELLIETDRMGRGVETVNGESRGLAPQLEEARSNLAALEEDFSDARDRVELMGLTQANGILLREKRMTLSRYRVHRQTIHGIQESMRRLELAIREIDKKRLELPAFEAKIGQALNIMEEENTDWSFTRQKEEVERALQNYRNHLTNLKTGCSRHLTDLSELENLWRTMDAKAKAFDEFIAVKLLWTANLPPISSEEPAALERSLRWLLDQEPLTALYLDIRGSLKRRPHEWLLGLVLWIALLVMVRWDWRRSQCFNAQGVLMYNLTFGSVLRAFVIIIGLSIMTPLGFWILGLETLFILNPAPVTVALGNGLFAATAFYAPIAILRALCQEAGIGARYFSWPDAIRRQFFYEGRFIGIAMIVIGFLIGATEFADDDSLRAVGRIVFMIAALAWMTVLFRLLQSNGGLMRSLAETRPKDLLVRFAGFWRVMAIVIPLALFGLAGSGYYYTALQLSKRALLSLALIFGLILIHEMLTLWIQRTRLQIWREQADQLKGELKKIQGPIKSEGEMEIESRQKAWNDLIRLDERTQALVRAVLTSAALVGLWVVWSAVLPALQFMNEITLYSYTVLVNDQTQVVPITVTKLALATLFTLITIGTVRHLPYALELILLKRMGVDKGGRYAASTICRYIVIGIGTSVIFYFIGLRWGHIQWLVAALGIGLGFGLQEFVANFIAGIILLFERPIRVGDTVSVGAVDGTVSRIQIRATTITNWDRKELIVPNMQFITGQLINWTRSDPILRVIVPVGVAYGSDTAQVERLLLEAARKNGKVLNDPEPEVIFMAFGESALNFELRVHVRGVGTTRTVRSQLHFAVDAAFRKSGTVIAFPQHDIHIDAMTPLDIRLLREPKPRPEAAPVAPSEAPTDAPKTS